MQIWGVQLLTVDSGEVGQGPDCPMPALWCVRHPDQPENGLEATVVDVSVGVEVPGADGVDHLVHHFLTRRRLYPPRLGAVTHKVRQHAGSIVAHLKYSRCSSVKRGLKKCTLGRERWGHKLN